MVVDPDDGCTRTPKALLLPGGMQVPSKQLNSLLALDEAPAQHSVNDMERALLVFPSFGSISNVGSLATPAASEQGEEDVSPQGNAAENAVAETVRC